MMLRLQLNSKHGREIIKLHEICFKLSVFSHALYNSVETQKKSETMCFHFLMKTCLKTFFLQFDTIAKWFIKVYVFQSALVCLSEFSDCTPSWCKECVVPPWSKGTNTSSKFRSSPHLFCVCCTHCCGWLKNLYDGPIRCPNLYQRNS